MQQNGRQTKGKVKVHPRTGHEGPEGEQRYTLLFLSPRRQMGWVVNATPRPLYPRKSSRTHCTVVWIWGGMENPSPNGIRFHTPQPVAIPIPSHTVSRNHSKIYEIAERTDNAYITFRFLQKFYKSLPLLHRFLPREDYYNTEYILQTHEVICDQQVVCHGRTLIETRFNSIYVALDCPAIFERHSVLLRSIRR